MLALSGQMFQLDCPSLTPTFNNKQLKGDQSNFVTGPPLCLNTSCCIFNAFELENYFCLNLQIMQQIIHYQAYA